MVARNPSLDNDGSMISSSDNGDVQTQITKFSWSLLEVVEATLIRLGLCFLEH